MTQQKNVAVIGANGFVGSHLASRLARMEDVALHLYGRAAHCKLQGSHSYTQLDLTDIESIRGKFNGMEVVYHLASDTIPISSWMQPVREVQNNLLPFLALAEELVSAGVKKLVFISSAGTIYGEHPKPVTEESFMEPFSPYGINKLAMEHYLRYYNKRCGLGYDIYRVSNVYGEGQDTGKGLGIINTFLESILANNKVTIFGDGESVRNYLYVKDLAEVLSRSAVIPYDNCGVYNVASDDTISINQLVQIMREVVGMPFDEERLDTRKSDNPIIIPSNAKIRMATPGLRFVTLQEGIAATLAHIRQVMLQG